VTSETGLITSEDGHHLKDSDEVDHEDDDVKDGENLRAKFDVLASEHDGKMRIWSRAVKEIELRHFPT
jgi:hypothetical protein